ncbi:zinc finger protein 888-like [Achroia grisella]|uniref:zinc finger protein 888-like n=1 Tax=Achroia grisella TaxID=688607 RepID=UPI0027D31DAA|nr:zinc finger protein 888-like [Achroia grisella]
MDFSSVCRTCMSKSSLNPIFTDNGEHRRSSVSIFLSTGVKVEYNDGLPQTICSQCIKLVNKYIKFRKKCKDVERILLKFREQTNNAHSHIVTSHVDREIEITETEPKDNDEMKDECSNYEIGMVVDEDDKPLKYLIKDIPDSTDSLDDINNKEIEVTETENELNETTEIELNEKKQIEILDQPYDILFGTDKKRRVMCKLCQKNLSVRSIDSHLARRHPGADKRKVKCDLCDNYVLKEKMNRHRVLMHSSGALCCRYCKSEYDSQEHLIDHVTTCPAKKRKRKANESGRELTECDVCHKIMQKASLRMHKAIKHAGLGPVCEHCGKRFGNKFRLNEHLRAKHGYEKFKCSYCEFQSAGVMSMRNHERRHRGEKPFVCESCGARFHAAYLLSQHRQSHRTDKPVKCPQCPATFKANNSLHVHRSTCHGGAAHVCPVCARAYRCRHYAARHLRHVHRTAGRPRPAVEEDRVEERLEARLVCSNNEQPIISSSN